MLKPLLPALAVLIAGSFVAPTAVEADPSVQAPRASLVQVMRDSGQVLLYDRDRREYLVLRQGDGFQGFSVVSVEGDQVVLRSTSQPGWHFVLPLASSEPGPIPVPDPSMAPPPVPVPPLGNPNGDLGPVDPWAPNPAATGAPKAGEELNPVDPYAPPSDDGTLSVNDLPPEMRSVTAPPVARAKSDNGNVGIPAPPLAVPAPPTGAGTGTLGVGAAVAEASKPAPAPEEKARTETHKISRRDLDSALSDFQVLEKEVQFSKVEGGILLADLAKGSFLFRMGLRKGDVVLTVAGRPIDSTEQAADAYVAITVADQFDVVVKRGDTRLTLQYQVTAK